MKYYDVQLQTELKGTVVYSLSILRLQKYGSNLEKRKDAELLASVTLRLSQLQSFERS
jgi:hypothetical protein